MTPMVMPMLPAIGDFAKTSATKAVTGIVNYAIAKIGGRKKDSEMAIDLAGKALAEMGQTSRTAIEADPDHRTNGEITDPILLAANNPYSAALNSQRWLPVVGKPQLKDGEIERLYISDLAPILTP